MKLDVTFAARLYCAAAGATLIALGLAAWQTDRTNPYTGAMLAGSGLFLIAGTFGRTTRLTAMLALCALFFGGAGLAGIGYAALSLTLPPESAVGLMAAELFAAAIAGGLARSLFREELR